MWKRRRQSRSLARYKFPLLFSYDPCPEMSTKRPKPSTKVPPDNSTRTVAKVERAREEEEEEEEEEEGQRTFARINTISLPDITPGPLPARARSVRNSGVVPSPRTKLIFHSFSAAFSPSKILMDLLTEVATESQTDAQQEG